MYAMTGRLVAQLGKRGELVHILKQAAELEVAGGYGI